MTRPICIVCKVRKVGKIYKEGGKFYYRRKCDICRHGRDYLLRKESKRRPWVQHKKTYCESCGFVAAHPCQLDVDHIDGNRENNDASNYQTLCANCHRLKSYQNKQGVGWAYPRT